MARDFSNQDNKLVKWLKANDLNQGEFADTVGTYQTTISRLCRGSLVPTLELACRIEDATDGAVSHRYWLELQNEEAAHG